MKTAFEIYVIGTLTGNPVYIGYNFSEQVAKETGERIAKNNPSVYCGSYVSTVKFLS